MVQRSPGWCACCEDEAQLCMQSWEFRQWSLMIPSHSYRHGLIIFNRLIRLLTWDARMQVTLVVSRSLAKRKKYSSPGTSWKRLLKSWVSPACIIRVLVPRLLKLLLDFLANSLMARKVIAINLARRCIRTTCAWLVQLAKRTSKEHPLPRKP